METRETTVSVPSTFFASSGLFSLSFPQERIILLCEKSIFRINYDFDTKKVMMSENGRTLLKDLQRIQHGQVMWPDKVAMHVMKNGAAKPGLRLFTSVEEPGFFQRWNPAASVDYSTFASYSDFREGHEEDAHKDVVKFQDALINATRAANPECHILESSIKLDTVTGIVSKLRNEGQFGEFRGTRLAEASRAVMLERIASDSGIGDKNMIPTSRSSGATKSPSADEGSLAAPAPPTPIASGGDTPTAIEDQGGKTIDV